MCAISSPEAEASGWSSSARLRGLSARACEGRFRMISPRLQPRAACPSLRGRPPNAHLLDLPHFRQRSVPLSVRSKSTCEGLRGRSRYSSEYL